MSQQQEMHDSDGYQEQAPYVGGYSDSAGYRAQAFGQKLSNPPKSAVFTTGQRLALAIVSLILWVLVFFIVILGVTSTASSPQVADALQPILGVGLLFFSILVLVINILFNRKG